MSINALAHLSHVAKTALLFVILSFSQTALAQDPIETGLFNNKAIYGYDTVAYFTQDKAVKGSKTFTTTWRGADWFFSSQTHLDLFKADPEKYAPQYGGYCAYAMATGDFVGIDEDAFVIDNGKLYLNYSASVQQKWLANKAQYIQQADAQYPY
ncbi:YHS domain-containing (seleno)protein [Paraglaciecola sp. L1A13]|uniref:YHS domain-containing (seleno)protein n=1 Tax=Paraglaciecola sp. L1A13 TaxID=2686359 RepID=UPI00131B0AF3|nr:YHS domain-containing (seleno)protein [Paraglaciecola sp. L1A13]